MTVSQPHSTTAPSARAVRALSAPEPRSRNSYRAARRNAARTLGSGWAATWREMQLAAYAPPRPRKTRQQTPLHAGFRPGRLEEALRAAA